MSDAGAHADTDVAESCYICHCPQTEAEPYVATPQCECMKKSYAIHNSCFKKLLERGNETCSICKRRWAFLPTLVRHVKTVHNTSYNVECMKEQRNRLYGPYKEYWTDTSGLHMEAHYRNGVLDGWMTVYERDGRLRSRIFYEAGLKQGAGVHYRGGAVHCYVRYLHGARHGQTLYLKKDGSYNYVREYYYGQVAKVQAQSK